MNSARLCDCESGLLSYWQYDARGIELCRTCDKCHESKMAGYRADVLSDPRYAANESIEEE
jgi:hypothetical protein